MNDARRTSSLRAISASPPWSLSSLAIERRGGVCGGDDARDAEEASRAKRTSRVMCDAILVPSVQLQRSLCSPSFSRDVKVRVGKADGSDDAVHLYVEL